MSSKSKTLWPKAGRFYQMQPAQEEDGMREIQYNPRCYSCRKDAGKPAAGVSEKKLCVDHLHFHIDKLKTSLQEEKQLKQTLDREIYSLEQWVNDLQSRMYINCVYCGHRYGPKESTPVSMADVLREHIEQCPKHPLFLERQRNRELVGIIKEMVEIQGVTHDDPYCPEDDTCTCENVSKIEQALKEYE